ncbi:MAG TPA: alpha/beta fold hydrolase [Candidatus Binatia bacterium]
MAALLAACSGSSSSPPEPDIAWHDCDPEAVSEEYINQLGERLKCATLAVPLDHDDPRGATIELGLSRVAAGDPSRRRNAIFVNPGGPGADGLSLGAELGALFALADPSDPLGAKLRRISDEYDVIGFSPRGLGSSTHLTCELDAQFHVTLLASTAFTPENLNAIHENKLLEARACRANPLTPYINTDAVVRDIDFVREKLGDEKVSYIGYSYGTWLGLWYASRFPERVDRMMLDSVVNYTLPSFYAEGDDQAVPLQFILDELVSPYAAALDPIFGLGSSPDEIRGIFGELPVELQTVLSSKLYGLLFSQKAADDTVVQLGAAKGVGEVLHAHPDAPREELEARVAERRYAPDDEVDEVMREAASELLDGTLELKSGERDPVELDPESAVNKAVVCNDGPSPTDPEFWIREVEAIRDTAPVFARIANCTDEWGGPSVAKPDVEGARRVPNILFVQNQYDGATPLDGALKTRDLLGNVSLVYQTRDYTHGVFPSQEVCIDDPVAEFFAADEIPDRYVVECEGKGLLDGLPSAAAGALPETLRAQAVRGASGDASSAYLDPDVARTLAQRIHDQIRSAAAAARGADAR